ncbi:phosphotransferase [Pedobacter sp.]|uniref:phosphotransferase n=1 Tax=Pedobacter sp. TaxID=1411316 RepID=UPI003C3E9C09
MFILDANDTASMESYLLEQGWLSNEERISQVSVPGEGNMNYVLRIVTRKRSFIVKQSRGYVEKYPHLSAPADRVLMEGAFYQTTNVDPFIARFTPDLIGIDQANNIIALEDLGMASDFLFLYNSSIKLDTAQLTRLTDFLGSLHNNFYRQATQESFKNSAMKSLNHEHIFRYPFMEENGFDLDLIQPGLQAVATDYKNDKELKNQIEGIGEIYLSEGSYLLHGDFYPGSWLDTAQGVKIIDPEFCFYGPREFDLGVMMAHLYLSRQQDQHIQLVLDTYHSNAKLDIQLLHQFTGIEILRRIIGIAQLPLSLPISQKQELLKFAKTLIL